MRAGETNQLDDLGDPVGVEVGATRLAQRDLAFVGGGLIVDSEAAHPVVHRARDAGGADGIERVHRRDEAETGRRGEPTEARHVELALAHHRDQHVQRLFGDAVDLLDVQQRPVAQRRRERPVDEDIGVVPLGHHPCRIEVADEASRGQLGVALDELEPDAEFVRHGAQQRRLAGAGRPLDDHVTVGDQRSDDQFDLTSSADDGRADRRDEFRRLQGRGWDSGLRHVTSSIAEPSDPLVRVDGSAVNDDTADVRAVAHRLVAVVDLVERVAIGDQLVELELAVAVQVRADWGCRHAG